MSFLIVILIALLFCILFSGMEIVFVSSDPIRIEMERKQELFSSRIISIFTSHTERFHITMLTGNVISLSVFGISISMYLEQYMSRYILPGAVLILLQIIISATIVIITAEFLPRIFFRMKPNFILNLLSIPTIIVYILLFPINSIIYGILKNRKVNLAEKKSLFEKTDLVGVVNHLSEPNAIEQEKATYLKLFQNALEFSSVRVRDCMVPRTEIVSADINTSVNDLHQKFVTSGFSKILIYQDNSDNIIGYITSKTLFKKMRSLNEWLIDAPFVPETMPAHKLLKKFIQEKKNLAVVVDEFGGVSGMLTIEDIIEEIFGEIEDEYDTIELIEKQISDKEYIFSGRLEIEYINEKYHLRLPESEEYDTLAGFIFFHHEKIPTPNDLIKIDPYEFKILKVTRTKIELVQMKSVSG